MVKKAVRSLTMPLALMLALGGLSPTPPATYVQIIRLESARSLGNGQLAQLANSADRAIALRALLAIGRTKQQAGLGLLVRHAGDRDPARRAMSVYGMGLIGGTRAAAPVLRALVDRSDIVNVSALDAVTRLEHAGTFSPTNERKAFERTSTLLRAKSALLRARAATALESFSAGREAGAASAALVAGYGRERDPGVRWHEMWSLYRGYASRAPLAVFERGLKDGSELVRIQAVRALGKRGDAAAAASLQPLLRDASWRVREQTLESLRVLHGGAMTEHLTRIPAGVATPAPQPDKLAYLPALARTPESGKPGKPVAENAIVEPLLDPTTAAAFTGPQRGPHPRVRIVTTEGNIYLELYPEWAPLTVENFLSLANRGYYDNNRWFRIVPDFVVQTGDPTGSGEGDAGYMIPAEENPIEQDSYVISMGLNYTDPPNAHAIRDSAGTQFYITLSPQLHLNSDFTVFGRVIGGADVLGRLVESDKIVRVERLPDSKS